MKWIVTGAAGFIGHHCVARLLGHHYEVVAVDNLSRPGSNENLRWLREQGLQSFINADVRDQYAMQELVCLHHDVDAVLHLASQVAVTTSIRDPRADFEINALGTFNLLEAVREFADGNPAFLLSSTNKVYGGLEHLRTVEEATRYSLLERPDGIAENEPLNFHSPYGCSKGTGDQYVRDYARVYGMRTVVFRQSCIYGTRQFGIEDQGWLAWFCIAALLGKTINIYGNGKQVRDALWVDDLVDLYLLAVDKIEVTQGQVFNVGGGPQNTISILELVAWLERALGRCLPVRFAEARQGDQKVFVASVQQAEQQLRWRPNVSVHEGLARLLDWAQEHRETVQQALAARETASAIELVCPSPLAQTV